MHLSILWNVTTPLLVDPPSPCARPPSPCARPPSPVPDPLPPVPDPPPPVPDTPLSPCAGPPPHDNMARDHQVPTAGTSCFLSSSGSAVRDFGARRSRCGFRLRDQELHRHLLLQEWNKFLNFLINDWPKELKVLVACNLKPGVHAPEAVCQKLTRFC